MSEIRRLIRLASERNIRENYTAFTCSIMRTLDAAARRKANEERITLNVVIEAVLRGYVNDHPAVLAMIDQWLRDENREPQESVGPRISKKEIDEIFEAIRRNNAEGK